jgi:hypothetical protein
MRDYVFVKYGMRQRHFDWIRLLRWFFQIDASRKRRMYP